MAVSVNKVTLVGRLGNDPDEKGSGDSKFAVCSVATSRSWKNRSGDREERTEWHRVVVYNTQAAGFLLRYGKKGDLIYLEGSIETREYEQDGVTKKITEVVVRPFEGSVQLQSKDGRSGDGDSGGSRSSSRSDSRSSRSDGYGGGSAGGRPGGTDIDDEIPFAPEFR